MQVLALDIGGTKLAAGVVADSGDVLSERVAATDVSASPTEILDVLFAMSEDALRESRISWSDLSGVGVSFGGPVDFPAGKTVTCHHLPGWEGFPLRDTVARRTGLPTVMDNDANAAALAEVMFGAARGCRDVLYLTVSTGVGGGVVIGGRIHRGANSMAGEIGHTYVAGPCPRHTTGGQASGHTASVAPEGPECTCGRRGCLEAVAAGPAIAGAARAAIAAGEQTALAAVPPDELTAKQVAEAAAHDPVAARIVGQAGWYLGLAIAAAVNLLDPEMVVIGGGVSQAGDMLFGPVRESVQRHAVAESATSLRIVGGALGQRGGLLGAAALAFADRP